MLKYLVVKYRVSNESVLRMNVLFIRGVREWLAVYSLCIGTAASLVSVIWFKSIQLQGMPINFSSPCGLTVL